jgi:nucleoside-diphosphate-sugar epimerase
MPETRPLPSGPAPGANGTPAAITSEEQLEERLSCPSVADVAFLAGLDGDILILGAGGKMGPSLARRVRRAADAARRPRRVIAVSRFSQPALAQALERDGIETISCNLLEPAEVERLPDAEDVLFLAGMKFGATAQPGLTWALNTLVPANVARRFSASRIVAFSTGNVYPLTGPGADGSVEEDAPGPVGEYAQSCLGRERVFEHFSSLSGTPVVLYRLFYAVDLRYGVPVDIARKVLGEEPIDLSVGSFNAIWQGDALSYALRSLALCSSPPFPLNVAGPDLLSVREVAEAFGRRFGKAPRFVGEEGRLALRGNASRCHALLGPPAVSSSLLLDWVGDWVARGGRSLGKPTGYEKTNGRF